MADAIAVRQELQLTGAEIDELSERRALLQVRLSELEAQEEDDPAEVDDDGDNLEQFSEAEFPWTAKVRAIGCNS